MFFEMRVDAHKGSPVPHTAKRGGSQAKSVRTGRADAPTSASAARTASPIKQALGFSEEERVVRRARQNSPLGR